MRFEVDTAIDSLKENIIPQTGVEELDLLDSLGRVIAEDIVAVFPVPSCSKSAMDGYAVYYEDLKGANKYQPASLKVIDHVYAGDDPNTEGKRGTAVRIMTGAKIPSGYNAVIKQESTNNGENIVEIYDEVEEWENYCKVGEDVKEGTVVIKKNTLITPPHISVIASLGYATVNVLKKMKVAIISTGSEVIEPGEKFSDMATYDSTTFQIVAILQNNEVEVVSRIHCRDDEKIIEHTIQELSNYADVIITTGGISVGDKDLMPNVLKSINSEVLFRGVNIKPGTPVTAAKYDNTIILCCSGNPFACLVNFHVFFWPMLAKKMNCNDFIRRTRTAIISKGVMKPKKYTSYVRAYYENGEVEIETDGHNSSIMSSAIGTNCFAINDTNETLEVGDRVKVQLI